MPRTLTPDDLLDLELAGDPQLSPDGRRLAFVVARTDKEENEYRHRIYLMNATPGSEARPFTSGTKSDRHPRWSPDGNSLAFVSNRSGKSQIWLIGTTGGEARQLTRLKDGVLSAPVWSPDGRSVAVTAIVGSEGALNEDHKEDETDLFKKFTKRVKRINRIWYKTDGDGYHDPEKHEQVFVIAVDGSEQQPRQVTTGRWNHSQPAWSPDNRTLAFVANRREDDDYHPFLQDVWIQDLAKDCDPVRVTPGTLSLGHPAWSPDGGQIAFAGYEWEPYRGYSSTHLFVISSDGTGLCRVDQGWDRTFGSAVVYDTPAPGSGKLVWSHDGRTLYSLGADSGRQQVYAVNVASGAVSPLTAGDHCVTSWSIDAQSGKVAAGLTRPDIPGDVFLLEAGKLVRMTHLNEALFADIELAPVEAFSLRTAPGTNAYVDRCGTQGLQETDGWIMKPIGFDPSQQYPAILQIHGGPMAMYGWSFFIEFQCLAAQGYAVVYTNPRGSVGYTQNFCACIKEDWGNLDYQDVMAGLDAALSAYPWIDASHLGVAGGSYGGFMTNWVVGHTDRFKAAVTMRSVVNEASSVGTSDFGYVDMSSYPSRPWEDMTFYRRVSPLTFVENIHTPLLIEHQEEDYRCPMEQAEQLYTALKVLRRTVEFVRYPDSSHGMSRDGKPWFRVYRLRTNGDWFDRYL